MPPNTRTLKGQSYSTKRWANLAWPKGSKLSGFSIYTTNPAEFIECSFKGGDLTGIVEEDRIDKAVINSSDLDKLQSGLIYYSYSFKSPNAMFNDAYYDEVVKGQTNYYLK